jgi:hypothetical protein
MNLETLKMLESMYFDCTTFLIYNEVVYNLYEEYDFEVTDEYKMLIWDYCSSYDYDWTIGLGWDDIQDIINDLSPELGLKV